MVGERRLKVAMSLLVRDEADIISENICFHAASGIEKFVVTDNGSTDGTREILQSLSNRFDIHIIDEPRKTIDQDLWVTRMAEWLRDHTDADWVINNDADEFWLTDAGSLPRAIRMDIVEAGDADIGVLECARYNYLPTIKDVQSDGYRFYHNRLKVVKNPGSGGGATRDNVLITLQGEKVASRLKGLRSVAMGNHAATHTGQSIASSRVSIAHYPLRSYDQFRKKVFNHGSSIDRNERFGAEINWHLRSWYESLQRGQLEQEYNKYAIDHVRENELIRSGVLKHDSSLYQRLREFDRSLALPLVV